MDKELIVLGAGESGTGAALLAKAKGFRVFVSDCGKIKPQYQAELEEAGIPAVIFGKAIYEGRIGMDEIGRKISE